MTDSKVLKDSFQVGRMLFKTFEDRSEQERNSRVRVLSGAKRIHELGGAYPRWYR